MTQVLKKIIACSLITASLSLSVHASSSDASSLGGVTTGRSSSIGGVTTGKSEISVTGPDASSLGGVTTGKSEVSSVFMPFSA